MPAAWSDSSSFNTAAWEARMARSAAQPASPHTASLAAQPAGRRVISAPPGDYAPPMMNNPYSARLKRASRLLRERLNAMEVPPAPLSPLALRLLSHQTSRLSRIVERFLIASKRYDEEHREQLPYAHTRPAA